MICTNHPFKPRCLANATESPPAANITAIPIISVVPLYIITNDAKSPITINPMTRMLKPTLKNGLGQNRIVYISQKKPMKIFKEATNF